jgi:hypothetical protein
VSVSVSVSVVPWARDLCKYGKVDMVDMCIQYTAAGRRGCLVPAQ